MRARQLPQQLLERQRTIDGASAATGAARRHHPAAAATLQYSCLNWILASARHCAIPAIGASAPTARSMRAVSQFSTHARRSSKPLRAAPALGGGRDIQLARAAASLKARRFRPQAAPLRADRARAPRTAHPRAPRAPPPRGPRRAVARARQCSAPRAGARTRRRWHRLRTVAGTARATARAGSDVTPASRLLERLEQRVGGVGVHAVGRSDAAPRSLRRRARSASAARTSSRTCSTRMCLESSSGRPRMKSGC